MPPPFSGDVFDFFRNSAFIERAAAPQADPRTVPDDLWFLQRTPVQDVTNHELRARWRGTAVIADMITADASSHVYKMLEIKASQVEIFKVKFGTYLAESDLELVSELGRAQFAVTRQMPDFIARILTTLAQQLTLGRRWRLEQMVIWSHLNTGHYDRNSVIINGGWGKKGSLIITLAVPVTDPVASKPISAIRAQMDYMAATGAGRPNRFLCSTALFDLIAKTDEFKSEAQSAFISLFSLTTVPVTQTRDQRLDAFKRILPQITEVVLLDSHFRYEVDEGAAPDGRRRRYLQRFWPINAGLLMNTIDDNNAATRYIGNGTVLEADLINRVGAREFGESGPAELGAGRRGPFYYSDVPNHLDPAEINLRVVQRCWPIVNEPNTSSVIYFAPDGAIVEPIPVEDSW